MTEKGFGQMKGKSVFVSGAAKGIGEATAERFAVEGARLMLLDSDQAALEALASRLKKGGVEVQTIVGDVSEEETVKRAIAETVAAFGALDVLVANAGVIPEATLESATADLWDRTMSVDGRGMFLCCKYAAAAMEKRGKGAIVCLSSISGCAGQPGQAVYGPAKFVASGITKHLAVELAPKGIRVNAVAPGTIETPAVAKLSEEGIRKVVSLHPIGRMGKPSEIANAILFLASDVASFITGAILPVDGGYLAQ